MTDGGVTFEHVWLDDPRRCTWGVCDLTVDLPAETTIALLEPEGQGASESVVALLTGRRRPVRGLVRFGTPGRVVAIETTVSSGEQRLTVAGGVTVVTHPPPHSIAGADLLLRFDAGFLVGDPALAGARHESR